MVESVVVTAPVEHPINLIFKMSLYIHPTILVFKMSLYIFYFSDYYISTVVLLYCTSSITYKITFIKISSPHGLIPYLNKYRKSADK